MQTREEVEQAERIARQLRTVQAAVAQAQSGANSQIRQELNAQLAEVQAQRDQIASQLQNPMVTGANRAGLERRIEQLDNRIASLDGRIAELDGAVARAGAQGGRGGGPVIGVRPPGEFGRGADQPPPGLVIGGLFMLCVMLPLSIAYARRIWHRGATAVGSLPKEIAERLSRMDQNLDTIALEVERIGEGQRFLTRAYAEQQGLPAGVGERVEVPERVRERQRGGA
jgi:uncharacterized coiled-coil protein SlyX